MKKIVLEDKIKDIIEDKLGINRDEITMDADLRKDLSADSLDISELIMALENEYSVSIPETEMINIKTVGDVVEYLYQKTEQS